TILGLGGAIAATLCPQPFIKTELYNMIHLTETGQWFSNLFIVLTIGIVALGNDFYKNRSSRLSDFISLKIFVLIGAVCMIAFEHFVMFFMGVEILSISLYVLAASVPDKIKSNEAGMKYFLMGSFASGLVLFVIAMISFGLFVMYFMCLEILSISLFVLATSVPDKIKSNEAGMKYFLMGSFAPGFVLFGIALIYGATGSFYIENIALFSSMPDVPLWLPIGFAMVVIGMLFKIAAFPFHFWAPDVYQGAPLLTTTTMSTLAKVAAMASLFKLSVALQGTMPALYTQLIYALIVCTMFVGNIVALKQTNIKRMLAYSGISHAGF